MSKIKEIKKIESNIKEIPKEIESIDDEFEDEQDYGELDSLSFSRVRHNRTSTLEATESRQETFEERQARISKEDREEINFRPSYIGGGNSYKGNSYTPVGSSESSSQTRDLGERNLGQDRNLQDHRMESRENQERNYAGEQGQSKDRKRNLM